VAVSSREGWELARPPFFLLVFATVLRPPVTRHQAWRTRLRPQNEEPDTCSLPRGDLRPVLHQGGVKGRKSLRRTGERGRLDFVHFLFPSFLSSGRLGNFGISHVPSPRSWLLAFAGSVSDHGHRQILQA
jgi:hypothetical protein